MNYPLVELTDVCVVRDGNEILHRVNLQIEVGQHTAILGPNGCGKSTLIKLLTREIYPFAGRGTVRILGQERWLQKELRTVLGVVSGEPKEPLLGDPSALDVVVSGLFGTYGVLWGYDITPEILDQGRAAMAALEIGHLENRRVDVISAGEHRRVFIARALISNPHALVMDEPTTGLDIKATGEFLKSIRRIARSGKTLVMVTHHIEEIVPETQRVVLMRNGSIVADGPTDEVLTERLLSHTFDSNLRLISKHPFRAVIADAATSIIA